MNRILYISAFLLLCSSIQGQNNTPVTWDKIEGCVEKDSVTILKRAKTGWDNASAISKNSSGSSSSHLVQVEYDASYTAHVIGLTTDYVDARYSTIEYCLYMYGGKLFVMEGGKIKGAYGTLKVGEVVSILYDKPNSKIHYMKDGVIVRSSSTSLTDFKVQISLHDYDSYFKNITTTALSPELLVWSEEIGLLIDPGDNSVEKTAPNGSWTNAFAVSQNYLLPGESGAIRFTVNRMSRFQIGLIEWDGNGVFGNTEMDHYFYFTDKSMNVMEERTTISKSYKDYKNSEFIISKSGNKISFLVDGVLLRVSSIPDDKIFSLGILGYANTGHPYVNNVQVDMAHLRPSTIELDPAICVEGSVLNTQSVTADYTDFDTFQWLFVNDDHRFVEYVETRNDSLSLTEVPSLVPGRFYDISVRGQIDTVWGHWGEVCAIEVNFEVSPMYAALTQYPQNGSIPEFEDGLIRFQILETDKAQKRLIFSLYFLDNGQKLDVTSSQAANGPVVHYGYNKVDFQTEGLDRGFYLLEVSGKPSENRYLMFELN